MVETLLPGHTPGGLLLPSADPTLPSELAEVYAKQQAVEQSQSLARVAALTGEMERSMASVVSMIRGLAEDTGAVGPGPGGGGAPPSTPSPSSHRTPDPEPAPAVGFREAYHTGRAMTMGSIATNVSHRAASYLQQRQPSYTEGVDEATGMKYVQPHGVDPVTNQETFGEKIMETDPRYESATRSMARAGALGRFAAGGGLSSFGGTLGTVARAAGPVGIAIGATVMAGQQVAGFFEGQQEKATQYRAAFGEQDTGMFAAGDRWDEFKASWSGFGTIGRERAAQQFQMASALGLRGEGREDATDFATDMYKRLGIDTAESMAIVERVVRNSNLSLSDFSEAITDVSEAAVKAGRSSKEAIDDFLAAQKALETGVTTGAASVGTAEALTEQIEKFPRELQSIGAEGLAGFINTRNVNIVASQTGQDPFVLQQQIAGGGSGAQSAILSTLTGIKDLVVQQVAATVGMSADELRSAVGPDPLNPEQRTQALISLGIQPQVLFSIMKTYDTAGVVTPANAVPLFFEFLQPETFNFSPTELGLPRTDNTVRTGPYMPPGVADTPLGSVLTNVFGVGRNPYERGNAEANAQAVLNRLGGGEFGFSGGGLTEGNGSVLGGQIIDGQLRGPGPAAAGTDAINAYVKYVTETGEGNAAIEKLLGSDSTKEKITEFTTDSFSDTKYLVNENGQQVEKTLDEIIANPDFMAQIASGMASIKGPNGQVMSVADVTGIADSNAVANARQNVRVEFTGEAKRYFRVAGPSDEQRAGVPASGSSDPFSWYYGGE